MVHEDGVALSSEKRLVRGNHSFLEQLLSGVDLIPCLDWVTLVRFDPDVMVHLLHSLFSVRFYLYSTSRRLFA